jgi:hypothetical protein
VALREEVFREGVALNVESHVAAEGLLGYGELIFHLLVEDAGWRQEYFRRIIACSLVYIFSSSSNCIYKLTINTNGDYPTLPPLIIKAKTLFFIDIRCFLINL